MLARCSESVLGRFLRGSASSVFAASGDVFLIRFSSSMDSLILMLFLMKRLDLE